MVRTLSRIRVGQVGFGQVMVCFPLVRLNVRRDRRNVRPDARACFRGSSFFPFRVIWPDFGGSVTQLLRNTIREVMIFIRFKSGGHVTPVHHRLRFPFSVVHYILRMFLWCTYGNGFLVPIFVCLYGRGGGRE